MIKINYQIIFSNLLFFVMFTLFKEILSYYKYMDKIKNNQIDNSKNNTQQNKYSIIYYLYAKIQNQISKQDDINNLIDFIIYS